MSYRTILNAPFIVCMLMACMLQTNAKGQAGEPTPETPKYVLYEFFSYNTVESRIVREQLINAGPASVIIKEKYNVVSIEQGQDRGKESDYNVNYFPTLIIAKPDGTEVDRITGFQQPIRAAATLKAALSGQSEIARIREKATATGAGTREHLTLAAALRLRGDHRGALSEYLWILDNGPRLDPKNYITTYRLAAFQLASLAMGYQPAEQELSIRRNLIEVAANGASPSPEVIEQIFALNEAAGQSLRNVTVYLSIPDDSPLKQRLFADVFPALIKAGKHKEAAAVADLEDFTGFMYPKFHHTSRRHDHEDSDHKLTQPTNKQKIIIWTASACEALIALGEVEKAKRVAGHALDYLREDRQNLLTKLNAVAAHEDVFARAFGQWLADYVTLTKK